MADILINERCLVSRDGEKTLGQMKCDIKDVQLMGWGGELVLPLYDMLPRDTMKSIFGAMPRK